MRLVSVLLVLALGAALPAAASAAKTNAPPGNSGISQYLEVVPSSTGSKASGRDPNKKSPLSQTTRKVLRATKDGQTLSRVINNTTPEQPAKSTKKQSKPKPAKGKAKTTTTQQESTTTEAKDAEAVALAYKGGSGGGGGSGIGVPLIGLMVGAAAVVGLFAAARRRGGAEPEPEL